ncbi:hypothetical protein ACTFIZ_011310 [Dictyostelium cf. discoideum]
MTSFKSIIFVPQYNANKTKKTFQIFKNDFPIDTSLANKVTDLIKKKEFTKLKELMKQGSKFVLSFKDIKRLLLNCHDREFYEILYEKKLLYNFNLIDEAIKLNDINALELMVQIFANGWDNYEENGPDFYKIMLKFSYSKSTFFKTMISNYIITKIKRIDVLSVAGLLIKQYYDVTDIDYIQNNKPMIDIREGHEQFQGFNNFKLKIIDQWRIYNSIISEYIKISTGLKSLVVENDGISNKIKNFGKKIMILRILMLDLESLIKLEKYKWNSIVNLDVSDLLNIMLPIHFEMNLENTILEISDRADEIPQIDFIYPKFSRLTKFSKRISNICFKKQYFSYYKFKKLKTRDKNGNETDLSLYSFLRDYYYNCNISLSTKEIFQFGEPNINKFYLPSKQEIISTLDNESINFPIHDNDNCYFANKFLKNVCKLSKEKLKKKYIPTRYSPPIQMNKTEETQKLFSQKLNASESTGHVLKIFPKVFSIPNHIEISFKHEHIKDDPKMVIERDYCQEMYNQFIQTQNDLLKEFELEEKLEKEKEKQKKKLQKLKQRSQLLNTKKLDNNKKKLELFLKKQDQQLILQKTIQNENKMKLKMKNKKKIEKKNKLLIEGNVNKFSKNNNKNNYNNNNNNKEEDNSEKAGTTDVNVSCYNINDISSNPIIVSNNKEDYDTFKNYLTINNFIFDEIENEDCLDPNIQNEIDEMVASLVYYDDDAEYENNNMVNNTFPIFFISC